MRTRSLLLVIAGISLGLAARETWDRCTAQVRSIGTGPHYAVIVTYRISNTRLARGPWRWDEAVAYSRRKAGRGGAEVEVVGLEP